MDVYYNEFDPFAVEWLRSLCERAVISPGHVDPRSINEVNPEDLASFRRVHFFSGIGGWDHALRLAGWPDEWPVWTGSCPCQPFSAAGKRQGTDDERHLWPEMLRLIAVNLPPAIFGEQVASKAGREWFAGVRADLETLGYAVGGGDLCAAGVQSPHIRQRLYWVAYLHGYRWKTTGKCQSASERQWLEEGERSECRLNLEQCSCRNHGMAFPASGGQPGRHGTTGSNGPEVADCCGMGNASSLDERRIRQCGENGKRTARGSGCRLEHAAGDGRNARRSESDGGITSSGCGTGRMVDMQQPGLEGHGWHVDHRDEPRRNDAHSHGPAAEAGTWDRCDLVDCRDGKRRRVPESESGVFPLAYGFPRSLRPLQSRLEGMGHKPAAARRLLRQPRSVLAAAGRNRVGRLKGYGNAIVPQLAAEFIRACIEVLKEPNA